MRRSVVLVLGMHRSGTSATAKVFNILGAGLPQHLLGKGLFNAKGHWESARIVHHHNLVLKEFGRNWYDLRPIDVKDIQGEQRARLKARMKDLFEQEFSGQSISVIKEPRICRFASLYIEALQDIDVDVQCVIPVRNPLEVAGSLNKRNGFKTSYSVLLWLSYMLDAELATRHLKRSFISYEKLIESPGNQLERVLKTLTLKFPNAVADALPEIKTFLSPQMKNHEFSAEQLNENPFTETLVQDAYSAFLMMCDRKKSQKSMDKLDVVRASFLNSAGYIFAVHEESNAMNRQWKSNLNQKQSELEGVQSVMSALKATSIKQARALQSDLTQKQFELEGVRREMVVLQKASAEQVDALQADLAQRQSQLASYENKTIVFEGELRKLRERIAVMSSKNTTLSEAVSAAKLEIENSDQRHKVLEQTLLRDKGVIEELRLQREDILSSKSWRVTSGFRKSSRMLTTMKSAVFRAKGKN